MKITIREAQARRFFEKFGAALGIETFDAYLDGTDANEAVPQIPSFPAMYVRLFGIRNICLVDRRVVKKVGLKEYGWLAGLFLDGIGNNTFRAFDSEVKKDIYWMTFHDGCRNLNRKPSDCRKTFASFEIGMDAVEGINLYTQNPEVIAHHSLHLPGSVYRENCDSVAILHFNANMPGLDRSCGDFEHPELGSASRGE